MTIYFVCFFSKGSHEWTIKKIDSNSPICEHYCSEDLLMDRRQKLSSVSRLRRESNPRELHMSESRQNLSSVSPSRRSQSKSPEPSRSASGSSNSGSSSSSSSSSRCSTCSSSSRCSACPVALPDGSKRSLSQNSSRAPSAENELAAFFESDE